MSTSPWSAVVTIALFAAGATAQPTPAREHLIDLTASPSAASLPVPPGINPLTLQVPMEVSSDSPKKPTLIRVSAPDLDRPDYRIADAFGFEVVFQNISDASIAFPTMRDGSTVDRDMAGAALASVALYFEDEVLGPQIVSPQLLYGANDLAGSLITVRPGERVRIRARGTWILPLATGTPYEPHWPRPLRVKATVTLVGNGVLRMFEQSNGLTPVQLGTKR